MPKFKVGNKFLDRNSRIIFIIKTVYFNHDVAGYDAEVFDEELNYTFINFMYEEELVDGCVQLIDFSKLWKEIND